MKKLFTHEELILSNQLDNAINEGLLDTLSKIGMFFSNIKGLIEDLWEEVEKNVSISNKDILDEIKNIDENLDGFTILKKINYRDVKSFLISLVEYADEKYDYTKEYYNSTKKMKNAFKSDSIEIEIYDKSVKTKLLELKKKMDSYLNNDDTSKKYKTSMIAEVEILISNKIIEAIKSIKNGENLEFPEFEKTKKEKEQEISNNNKDAKKISEKEAKELQNSKDNLIKKLKITIAKKALNMSKALENMLSESHTQDDLTIFNKYKSLDKDNYFNIDEIEKEYQDLSGEKFGMAIKITQLVVDENFKKYKNEYKDNLEIQQIIANVLLRLIISSLTTGKLDDELLVGAASLMTTNFGVGLNAPVVKDGNDDATTFTMLLKDLGTNNKLKTIIEDKDLLSTFTTNFSKITKVLINKTKSLNKTNQPKL